MSFPFKSLSGKRIATALLVSISSGIGMGLVLRHYQHEQASGQPTPPAELNGHLAIDGGSEKKATELFRLAKKLEALHQKLGPPQPGDWLIQHSETGQNFLEYLRSDPVTANGKRNTLYIQPLGPFTKGQKKIVDLSSEFMAHYFGVEVKVVDTLPLSIIPDQAQRVHPTWGMKQILSTHVLDKVLRPRLPEDAAAYIAFTAVDLYPDPDWNFVFGQASLVHRVGVWSIYRNGDPTRDEKSFRLCLLRTLKTATHETGHMFSINHCILYECNMCGSNNREESDRRPIGLCPECLPKIWWATGVDPVERFRKLGAFCKEQGLKAEQLYFEKAKGMLLEE